MRRVAILAIAGSMLAGCVGSSDRDEDASSEPPPVSPTETAAPSDPESAPSSGADSEPPAAIARGTERIRALRVAPPAERLPAFGAVKIADANYPAGLAAAPDGRIFFSELWAGRIRVIRRDGRVDPAPWADVNAVFGIEWTQLYHGGLSGIAFDPAFERNHFVYVVTQLPHHVTGFAVRTLIVRFTEVNGRGTRPRVILKTSASKFDNTYSLVFGPDGMLYIPTGFLGRKQVSRTAGLRGKILRVTAGGKAPGDNPFGSRAPLVWAVGLKNTFDMAFFPGSQLAIGGDNGTVGHDEINLLMPGNDYGYPAHEGVTRAPGLTPPMLDFGSEAPAPVGVIYYDGRRYPTLRGRFLMCMNHGPGMVALRIARKDPGRLRNMTPIVPECTVDVIQTADGSVVFSDAQAVYRLVQR